MEFEQEIDQYDYCDYPFAMEVVNGNIISMTKDFQVEVREKIMEKLQMSEKELASYLIRVYYDEESPDDKYALLNDYPENFFSSILGLDYEEKDFSPEGIGFYDSEYGWNAAELLNGLGYVLSENINDGAHGHDTNGVIFYSK